MEGRLRHSRIGGTDAGPVWALYEPGLALAAKHKNARDVFERVVHGLSPAPKKVMDRGLRVEPILRQAYLDNVGPLEPHPGVLFPEELPFAASSPDDFAPRSTVVDYKSVSVFGRHQWGLAGGDDHVPLHVLTQMLHNLAVANRDRAEVFVGFGRDLPSGEFFIEEFALYVIERDFEIERRLLAAEEEFWRLHVVPQVAPPVEPIGAIRQQIARREREAAHGRRIEREWQRHTGEGAAQPGAENG